MTKPSSASRNSSSKSAPRNESCSIPLVAAVSLSEGDHLFELTEKNALAFYLLMRAGKKGCDPKAYPEVNWPERVSELRALGIPICSYGTSANMIFQLLTSSELLVGRAADHS